MRAFVAIDLPDDVLQALVRLQMRIPVGRKVVTGNLHLTLAFLGDQPEETLEELHAELEALQPSPISVTVNGLGSFGGDKPQAVFADVAPQEALIDLQHTVRTAARRVGITLKRDRFHPHITLSRIGGRLSVQDMSRLDQFLGQEGGFSLTASLCSSFSLCQSTLGPKGARYDQLAQYDLF